MLTRPLCQHGLSHADMPRQADMAEAMLTWGTCQYGSARAGMSLHAGNLEWGLVLTVLTRACLLPCPRACQHGERAGVIWAVLVWASVLECARSC